MNRIEEEEHRDDLPRIVAEVCVRLREMDEAKHDASARFISSMYHLSCASRPAYQLLLSMSTDAEAVVAPFSTHAEGRGISRQAAHKDIHQSLDVIASFFPAIAAHISAVRSAAHAGHGNTNSNRL